MFERISGWFETDNGAEMFDLEGPTMAEIADQLLAIDPDAGGVDMEATNNNGDDVTQALYEALKAA